MEMTLTYARIADRVVADEYEAVTAQIDVPYKTAATPGALPAEIETAAMIRLRQEAHARMLGNGLCTRPVELECRMEQPARRAPTSRRVPSSSPSYSASGITPGTTTSPAALPFRRSSQPGGGSRCLTR